MKEENIVTTSYEIVKGGETKKVINKKVHQTKILTETLKESRIAPPLTNICFETPTKNARERTANATDFFDEMQEVEEMDKMFGKGLANIVEEPETAGRNSLVNSTRTYAGESQFPSSLGLLENSQPNLHGEGAASNPQTTLANTKEKLGDDELKHNKQFSKSIHSKLTQTEPADYRQKQEAAATKPVQTASKQSKGAHPQMLLHLIPDEPDVFQPPSGLLESSFSSRKTMKRIFKDETGYSAGPKKIAKLAISNSHSKTAALTKPPNEIFKSSQKIVPFFGTKNSSNKQRLPSPGTRGFHQSTACFRSFDNERKSVSPKSSVKKLFASNSKIEPEMNSKDVQLNQRNSSLSHVSLEKDRKARVFNTPTMSSKAIYEAKDRVNGKRKYPSTIKLDKSGPLIRTAKQRVDVRNNNRLGGTQEEKRTTEAVEQRGESLSFQASEDGKDEITILDHPEKTSPKDILEMLNKSKSGKKPGINIQEAIKDLR